MQLSVKSGRISYNKNDELLSWSFTNAAIVRNSFGEIKVDKKPGGRFKRIDPVDATIDAHALMLKYKNKESVDVKAEMEKYLSNMGWNS